MKLQKSIIETEEKISPQQKKFQRLSQKIVQQKAHLAEWLLAQKTIQARAQAELLPAYQQLRQIIFQQIEQLLKQKKQKMTKAQLAKLDAKIEQLALPLWQSQQMSEQQNNFLSALLKAYGHDVEMYQEKTDAEQGFEHDAEYSFEQDVEQDIENLSDAEFFQLEIAELKISLCAEYDLEIDFFDFDADDLDDFMQKFLDKLQQQEQLEFLKHFDAQERQQLEREMQREKAKAEKIVQQRAQAKKNAVQSMKGIYLKIVALIHPDREQDQHKKQEKTSLLQQVNQAYEGRDLLALLAFQVELGQQQNQLLANQQLKAYNLVLEEQLEKLSIDIEDVIDSFNWSNHRSMRSNRKPKVNDLYENYEQNWLTIREEIKRTEHVLAAYKDINILKELMRSRDLWEMH